MERRHPCRRVDDRAFFKRFREDHAVQYFYEPFLEAFDPALSESLAGIMAVAEHRHDWTLKLTPARPNEPPPPGRSRIFDRWIDKCELPGPSR